MKNAIAIPIAVIKKMETGFSSNQDKLLQMRLKNNWVKLFLQVMAFSNLSVLSFF
jgi:hypothetical protein